MKTLQSYFSFSWLSLNSSKPVFVKLSVFPYLIVLYKVESWNYWRQTGFLSLVKSGAHWGNYTEGEEMGVTTSEFEKGEKGLLRRGWKLAKFLAKRVPMLYFAQRPRETAAPPGGRLPPATTALLVQDSWCSTRHRSCKTRLQRTLMAQTWGLLVIRGVSQCLGSVRDLAGWRKEPE